MGQLNASSAKSSTVVGFVNGEPYSGPYHIHENADGIFVKMTGVVHSSVPHNIIYDSLEESIPLNISTSNDDGNGNGGGGDDDGGDDTPAADTTPPGAPSNLSVTTAANDNTPTITGLAEGSSTVKLYNGSTLISTVGASSSGSFSITVANPLADGTYSFTVTATDSSNNVSNVSTIAHTINTSGSGNGGNGGDGGDPGY